MNYQSRIILAIAAGTAVGLFLARFFGNHLLLVSICVAFSLATETVLRTMHNEKKFSQPSSQAIFNKKIEKSSFEVPPKAKKPKF